MKQPFQKGLLVFTWLLGSLICVKSLLVRLYNPDLWWHLAAGRRMVQTGSFLWTDVFSHTMQGVPWINFEWLSQILFYGFYVLGGFWGIYIAKVLLCVTVVFLLWLCARRVGGTGPALFLLSWVGFKVVQPRLQDRPELFTLFFMGLLVFILLRVRSKRGPWLIFALMVLWANTHAGFVYGLALLALFYLGAVWEGESPAYRKLLAWSFTAGLCGVLINPYGVKIAVVFWEHFNQLKSGDALITEWKTTAVAELPYFWSLYVACGVAMALGLLRRRPGARFWTPAVLFFAVWGTLFYRNAALLAFVAVPFLANFLATQKVKKTPWYWWVPLLLLIAPEARRLARPLPREAVVWGRFPVKACDFVRQHGIQGVMFNTYNVGGYIGWALGPERRVFMDGRYLFYSLLEQFNALSAAIQTTGMEGNKWPAYLNEKGIDYAIVDYSDYYFRYAPEVRPFRFSLLNALFPREAWALVFWDDAGLVFLKRTPGFKKTIKREEYRAVWPYNLDQMRFLLQNGQVSKSAVKAELARHRRLVGATIHGQEIENLLEIPASHLE